MMKLNQRITLLTFALFGSVLSARADVSLPKVLGDNMVLQRNVALPIWGSASAGEQVTVRFAGQEKAVKTDGAGHWQVNLSPLDASAKPRDLVVSGANTIALHNILVGEVWLCSGQSNMEYAVGVSTAGAPAATDSDPALAKEIKTAHYPNIRLFRVEKQIQPPDVVSDGWHECAGEPLAKFSAAGFFFAQNVERELKVPVGIVEAAWGGSRIEPWTPASAYLAAPAFAREAAATPLQIDGVRPSRYYDGMVQPLQPFALRGVLWYQGESNLMAGDDATRYFDKMNAIISGWRAAWNRPDLPFYEVQIAPYLYTTRKDKIAHSTEALPAIWEAQRRVLTLPNTGLVLTTDLVDDVGNIHPGHKREVGRRLANLALSRTYGRSELAAEGPVFDSIAIQGATAQVRWRNGFGLSSRDGKPLSDFQIAGADGVFVPAQAVIEGQSVVVSSPLIAAPTAVRLGWSETANPNLINGLGLPAYPFRSDAPVVK